MIACLVSMTRLKSYVIIDAKADTHPARPLEARQSHERGSEKPPKRSENEDMTSFPPRPFADGACAGCMRFCSQLRDRPADGGPH